MTFKASRVPAAHRRDADAMPAELRALLEAELAAGNQIVEVGHSFPAPPAGAYFKLARPVTTRPRAEGEGIAFRERNDSYCAGAFSDARGFFFVLEPPPPPPPEPDMDAIRARLSGGSAPPHSPWNRTPTPPQRAAEPAPLVDRFRRSMEIDYEKWREGIGYDLDALRAASGAERAAIEALLLPRADSDWRDVEALAALDTPAARKALLRAARTGKEEVRMAVLTHAPHLFDEKARTARLASAFDEVAIGNGLTALVEHVAAFHPPPVVEALLRAVLARDGGTAVHLAALALFVHGKAESSFDWAHRPFLLRFNTPDRDARREAFRELCARIGVAPDAYIGD